MNKFYIRIGRAVVLIVIVLLWYASTQLKQHDIDKYHNGELPNKMINDMYEIDDSPFVGEANNPIIGEELNRPPPPIPIQQKPSSSLSTESASDFSSPQDILLQRRRIRAHKLDSLTPLLVSGKASNAGITMQQRLITLLIKQAERVFANNATYSVTLKPPSQLPHNKDPHSYVSLAKYFWPNPDSPNGLPYIKRDGQVNPEVDIVKDYILLHMMIEDVRVLGLAYYFSIDNSTGLRDERFAHKAVERLKEWFINPETRMNPNVDYGSYIKGSRRGRNTGILDLWPIYRVLDTIGLLVPSSHLTSEVTNSLNEWFGSYAKWLETSPLAKSERATKNNHGTYFDVQMMAIYRFLNRTDLAREIAENAKRIRIDAQIKPDGRQPEELKRPISWYYSIFNLNGLFHLAYQARQVGVNLYVYHGPLGAGQSIRGALDYLIPYALSGGLKWSKKNVGNFNPKELLGALEIAYLEYLDDAGEGYIEIIEALRAIVVEEAGSGDGKIVTAWNRMDEVNYWTCRVGIIGTDGRWDCKY